MVLKLSYILPCYNVERYIADCLDSIYAQDLPEEDFEVICVDDCSTDGTCVLIERQQTVHSNLHLIRHQKNSRSGIARNTGIDNANGEYLCFVDADDILPAGTMTKLFSVASENKLDLLFYNDVIDNNGELTDESVMLPDSEVQTGNAFVENVLKGNIGKIGAPWAKLFNRQFLLQNKIRFSSLAISQDSPFVWEAVICAERVRSTNEVGYVYRVNDESVTGKKMKPEFIYVTSFLYTTVLVNLCDKNKEVASKTMLLKIRNEIKSELSRFYSSYLNYGEHDQKTIFTMIREKGVCYRELSHYMNHRQRFAIQSRFLGYVFFTFVVAKLFS